MSGTSEDITFSSQPFEPGTAMKKRKVAHPGSAPPPSSFEDELEMLNADMDVDIESKFVSIEHNIIAQY
jgi:hypothetical protein